MQEPKISLLLPCLNARAFLPERIDSILSQPYQNWEAIVLDSYSDDGSWEYFSAIAATDSRFRLVQVPKDGLYSALNRGLEMATGKYIHIATCDDTMHPDFLVETISALEIHPDVGIAATDVLFIDKNGAPYDDTENLLGSGLVRTSVRGEMVKEINLRPVPHDFLLHYSFRTVYFSLTQLVIRSKDLLPKHRFSTDVGSIADFGWALRLTLNLSTIHIPRQLATWRYHGNQLSLVADSTRASSMVKACESALEESSFFTPGDRKAIMLPIHRGIYSGRILPPNRLTLASFGFWYFIKSYITKRQKWRRAMTAANFGKMPFRESWYYFVLGLIGIELQQITTHKS